MRSSRTVEQANRAENAEQLKKQNYEKYKRIKGEEEIIEIIGHILETVSKKDVKEFVFEEASKAFSKVFESNVLEMESIFSSPEPPAWLDALVTDTRWHQTIIDLGKNNPNSMFLKFLLMQIYTQFPEKIRSLPCGCTHFNNFREILPRFSLPLKQFGPEFNQKFNTFIDFMKSDDAILTACAAGVHKTGNILFMREIWEKLGHKQRTKESVLFITYVLKLENCVSNLIHYILEDIHNDFEAQDFVKQMLLNFTENKEIFDEKQTTLSDLLKTPYVSSKKLTINLTIPILMKIILANHEIARTIYLNSIPTGTEPDSKTLEAIDICITHDLDRIIKDDKDRRRYFLFMLLQQRCFAIAILKRIEFMIFKDERKVITENQVQILYEINCRYSDLRHHVVELLGKALSSPHQEDIFYKKILGIIFFLMTFGHPCEVLFAVSQIGHGKNGPHVRAFFSRICKNFNPPFSIPFLESLLRCLQSPSIYPIVFYTNDRRDEQKTAVLIELRNLFEKIIQMQKQELENLRENRRNGEPDPLSALTELSKQILETTTRR